MKVGSRVIFKGQGRWHKLGNDANTGSGGILAKQHTLSCENEFEKPNVFPLKTFDLLLPEFTTDVP
jgi:hypothetical protein